MVLRLPSVSALSRPVSSHPRLTLFGRSSLLLVAELLANAVCWIACGVLFGRREDTRPILSLALLSWVSQVISPCFKLQLS